MFTQQQEKMRESDPVKIVRTFTQSALLFDGDSKKTRPNPDYHLPICQREDGKFCDVEGRLIPTADVPAYIREAGKPPKAAAPASQRNMSLAEAMQEASASNATADAKPAPARRARARKAK